MNSFRPAILAAAVIFVVTSAVLALSGCGEDAPDVTPTTSTGPASTRAPSASSSHSPSPAAAAAAVAIPTDCHALVDAQTYSSTFGATPLNATGVVDPGEAGAMQPQSPPAGASVEQTLKSAIQLRCVWRDPGADTTYLEATVATVEPVIAATYLDALAAKGYGCTQANGGRQCQLVTKNTQYPVNDAHTALLRDSVLIEISQSNFPTNKLMGSITATIWG